VVYVMSTKLFKKTQAVYQNEYPAGAPKVARSGCDTKKCRVAPVLCGIYLQQLYNCD
jgi:hypothetical protein